MHLAATTPPHRHPHTDDMRRRRGVPEVEQGSFTLPVYSATGATGGTGPAAAMTCKRIASTLLAEKRAQPYSKIIGWIQCVLNFSLIRSAIQCIHCARTSRHRPCRPTTDSTIALTTEEDRIPSGSPATNQTLPNMYMLQPLYSSSY